MAKRVVLVVEDDDATRFLLRTMVGRHDAAVAVAANGEVAIEMLRSSEFDTVILDIMLPKKNGFEVAEVIQELGRKPKLIVLSGLMRYFEDRFPAGTVMLQKPFEVDHLDAALRA